MASTTVSTHYNIILLGKTGSGKSASGNKILGKNRFSSKKVFKSVTHDVENDTVTFQEVTLDVYDTPGLFNTETINENVLDKWKPLLELDETSCTMILLVMKVDRFTLQDKVAFCLMEDFIPDRLIQNTWTLFTRGDELKREDLTIEKFIEDTEELKELVKRFQNRYHVFDNYSQNPKQVRTLINKIKKTARTISSEKPDPEDPRHRRILLVGKTSVGKSATGNTILREKRFISAQSSSYITSQSEIHHGVVSGKSVSVIDTPGLFDTKLSREKLSEEIGRSIYLSSPGPHAFLYVHPINVRFTEHEEDVIPKLGQIFGREMKKYTIILFNYGDQQEGKSVDMLIQKNSFLRKLVDDCGGRYHIFNNKERNREQIIELLQKIERMVEDNRGTHYSSEMYKEAARIRKNEESEDKGFKEFYKNNKRSLLIAAGAAGGTFLSGAAIGAVVGVVVGGPVGAAIGAAIGAAVGAGISLVIGAGVVTAVHKKAKGNKKRNQNTDREFADGDGGRESPDSELGSSDKISLLGSNIRHRLNGARYQSGVN